MASSRGRAHELIEAGSVTVGGAPAFKSSRQVSPADPINVAGPGPRFVGRGGDKLAFALDEFGIEATGRHVLDAGSSTGGFTDCLLQRGACTVLAVDVGTHQLHERIRADERVTVWEQTDIRDVVLDRFADDPDRSAGFEIIAVDLSFISTAGLLDHLGGLLAPSGDLVVLVKPQFEAGRAEAGRGRGVIRDPSVWKSVLHRFIDRAAEVGLEVVDLALSPVVGGKGNVEFLGHVRKPDILGPVNDDPDPTIDGGA